MRPVSLSATRVGVLIVSLVLLVGTASVGVADDWKGATETRDGIDYVMNPSEGMTGPVTITPQELWRIGGDSESDEEFFGVINQMATDPDGNVYLLDRQLSEVKVFSPAGEYLRTIGREGEGPGEFRQALDMFFLPDGNLGVLQLAPGRIVMLTPDGEPVGDHPLPENEDGATSTLVSGSCLGENILLVVSENAPQDGKVDITRALIMVDSEGNEIKRLLSSVRELEFVNFTFTETVWRTFDNRWRVGPADNLYAAEEYLDYAISVWDSEGNKKRVITREYEHWNRTDAQKEEMHDLFDALLQNQLPQYKIEISPHDPDITSIYPREDGTMWVLSSHGTRNLSEGTMGTFDVFDSEGRFIRQVTLMGEGEPIKDSYFFLGDRLFVVTDALEANIASRGGRRGAEADEVEPEPIAIICYKLDALKAGM